MNIFDGTKVNVFAAGFNPTDVYVVAWVKTPAHKGEPTMYVVQKDGKGTHFQFRKEELKVIE